MKQLIKNTFVGLGLMLLSLFWCVSVQGQQKKSSSTRIFLETGGGGGTHKSEAYLLGLKTSFKDKWGLGLSYMGLNMTPANLPSDYIPGSGYFLIFGYQDDLKVNMDLVTFSMSKDYRLDKTLWGSTSAGISYVNGDKLSYQKTQVTTSDIYIAGSTSSNYNITREKKSATGFMLQTDVNIALTPFLGMGGGFFANFNSIQSTIGFEAKLLLGNLGIGKRTRESL